MWVPKPEWTVSQPTTAIGGKTSSIVIWLDDVRRAETPGNDLILVVGDGHILGRLQRL